MPSLKLHRTRNREYVKNRDSTETYEPGKYKKQVVRPAEYAVYRGTDLLVKIVRNGRKWRACEPSDTSEIGLAISPIGIDRFREVKVWAFDYLEKK